MKIAVFCSANKNIDPDFFTMTEEMGKWMAENEQDRFQLFIKRHILHKHFQFINQI